MFKNIKEYYDVKKSFRKECYNKMLDFIVRKIENKALNGETYMLYEIPEFILGEPPYEINECSKYLMKELKKHSFLKDVSFYPPNVIFIGWKLDY